MDGCARGYKLTLYNDSLIIREVSKIASWIRVEKKCTRERRTISIPSTVVGNSPKNQLIHHASRVIVAVSPPYHISSGSASKALDSRLDLTELTIQPRN